MYASEEKVERGFLVDDLNQLGQMHKEAITLIDETKELINTPQPQLLLQNSRKMHEKHLKQLQAQANELGGDAQWQKADISAAKKVSLEVSEWFQPNSTLKAVWDKEQALKLEYERSVNQFTDVDGLADTLNEQFSDLSTFCDQMKSEMTQLGVAM